MDLFANELSIHGQFYDLHSFRQELARLMAMRNVAQRFGEEVYCHRELLAAHPISNMSMQQVLGRLRESERRAAMSWLTRSGPFWDDLRSHGVNDWLECRGEVVTDSGVGEAAFRKLHRVECGLISAITSDWDFSPVEVIWKRDDEGLDELRTQLENWRDPAALEKSLHAKAVSLRSWNDLQHVSMSRFRNLMFAENCFGPLTRFPFAKGAADRLVVLLGILDRLACAFDADGVQTPEAQKIYHNYFKGGNALFSDSSESEKSKFRDKLTFPHPHEPGESLFCTWHGKVRSMNLRLHYWWSGRSGDLVYVVYAGPKITRE